MIKGASMFKVLRLIFLIFILLKSVSGFGNPILVKTKITDQYGGTIKKIKIESFSGKNYSTLNYQKNDLGYIQFNANEGDSIFISAFGNQELRTSIADITSKNTLLIHKPFSLIDLVNPQFYIHYGGLWLLLFIVFAETGLFLGFFLPGDSLLFIAGVYSQNLAKAFYDTGNDLGNLLIVMILIIFAGILGNFLGYYMGFKSKNFFYNMKDTWYFKRKNLNQAHAFYKKYGGGAIFFARFLPIIRTFAPIVGGIVRMDKAKFTFYNIIGCIAWVVLLVGGGHYLDAYIRNTFHFELRDHLGLIVILLIVITTTPVIISTLSKKKTKKKINKNQQSV